MGLGLRWHGTPPAMPAPVSLEMALSSPLAALLCAMVLGPETADTVELRGARYLELREDEPRPPGPFVAGRELTIEAEPDGLVLTARWVIRSPRPAPFAARVLGPGARVRSLTWNGGRATTWEDQGVIVHGRVERQAIVEIQAFVPGSASRERVALEVLEGAVGWVRLQGEGLELRTASGEIPVHAGGLHFTGSGTLSVGPAAPRSPEQTLILGRVALGLTVGDAVVRGRARVQWLPRRGSVDDPTLRVAGLGPDLRVEGPGLAGFRREGDVLLLDLREPSSDPVTVDLTWSSAIPDGTEARVAIPRLDPDGVMRTESTLQVARDGDLDVIPRVDTWSAVADRTLPTWAGGLVEGAVTASYRRQGGAGADDSLGLFRFDPVEAPPVLVDIADHRVALTQEGRMLMRTRLEVRNERASHLRVRLPPERQVVAVAVANEPVRIAREPDGVLLIPLPRSVETVEGLLTFPVMIACLEESRPWRRWERRTLALPVVEAPINVTRSTTFLPAGYLSRLEPGEASVVAAFTRGESVQFGFDDDAEAARADVLFGDAVDAWNANDFERAQQRLDELKDMKAESKNIESLQSNVSLVHGKSSADIPAAGPAPAVVAETVTTRRVRAQARARAGKLRRKQRESKKKARDLRASGAYQAAEAEYRSALDASRELDKLEDEESKTYDFEADELEGELEEVQVEAAARADMEGDASANDDSCRFGGQELEAETAMVRAGGLVIIVPAAGQAVRYQHLLLEAGARRELTIRARRPPGRHHRTRNTP